MAKDDYGRSEYYGNPLKAILKRDSYNGGCRACINSVYDKRAFSWKCTEKVAEYPHETRDTCKFWMKK